MIAGNLALKEGWPSGPFMVNGCQPHRMVKIIPSIDEPALVWNIGAATIEALKVIVI